MNTLNEYLPSFIIEEIDRLKRTIKESNEEKNIKMIEYAMKYSDMDSDCTIVLSYPRMINEMTNIKTIEYAIEHPDIRTKVMNDEINSRMIIYAIRYSHMSWTEFTEFTETHPDKPWKWIMLSEKPKFVTELVGKHIYELSVLNDIFTKKYMNNLSQTKL